MPLNGLSRFPWKIGFRWNPLGHIAQQTSWSDTPGRILKYSALSGIAILCAMGLSAGEFDASAAPGDVHALVIGINAYEAQGGELQDLQGAVNDALDIATALVETGVTSLRVLLDEDAHRDAIFSAWHAMKADAKPGDTLLLTFAGHGAQEPERIPGSERDGLDEVTVLGSFRTGAPHNYQRIIDHEWRELVAAAPDFQVVLVFDACHSGSMNRSLARGRSRFGQYGAIREDQLPMPSSAPRNEPPGVLSHEVYLGATRDDLLVQEIILDGEPRGALSYLFGRALRGAADLDGDGVITRGEMRRFIDENVRQLTERRQFPAVLYQGSDDVPLFRGGGCPQQAAAALTTELSVAVVNAGIPGMPDRLRGVQHARAGTADRADLLWDGAGGKVVSHHGDVVAYISMEDLDPLEQWQGVIDKWRTLPALQALNECRTPLRLRIREGDVLHREGSMVTLTLEPRTEPYLTLINLPATGEVQWLYPLPRFGDVPWRDPRETYEMRFVVQGPFGGDHLIALTSRERPEALHRRLQELDGQRAAPELFAALQATLGEHGRRHELGILAFYTAPE